MDTDDDNGVHTIVDISTEPQLTPEMPTSPYSQRQKSSPGSQLRKEIFKVKCSIAEHKIDDLKAKISTLETQKGDFMARADKEHFDATVGSIHTLLEEKSKLITQDTNRLVWLEKTLERDEEAAAERAQASIKNPIKSFLSTEGPDIANIIDVRKFETMQAWLDDENVLLLRSPPCSGKTTFAHSFAGHLHSKGFRATYLNASQSTIMSGTESMDDVWHDAFDSTFSDMCKTPSEQDHYIIIDEAQSWYPLNVKDRRAQQELYHFWAEVKFFVKPALDLANLLSLNRSSLTGRVRLLCLAGYGENNVGSFVFVDPLDTTKKMRLPLGLEFLRLDREMTNALIARFVEIKELEGKKMSFDTDVPELIYEETNGHVGAVRTLLFHLVGTDKRSQQDVMDFTRREVYQTDLGAYRTFLPVSEATIRQLRPDDLATLVQCILLYKKGHREFPLREFVVAGLVKLGVFAKTSATAIGGDTTVAFPSPLHFDFALYNVLHRPVEMQQSGECFEQVLEELVLRMSPRVLQETTPRGDIPYGLDQWQWECHRSLSSMSSTSTLETPVGTSALLPDTTMCINAGFQWGIELMREGDGRQLEERFRRFRLGERMREYALINFTSEIPSESVLDRYDGHVWHLVYNNTYTQVGVYRKGRFTEVWDLIGHQGRTEY